MCWGGTARVLHNYLTHRCSRLNFESRENANYVMKEGQNSENQSAEIGSFIEHFNKLLPDDVNFTFSQKEQNGQIKPIKIF